MVIVCGIVAVLSVSVYLIFVNGNRLFTLQNSAAIAENQALKASLIMQRELREARAPEGLNLQPIEEASEQSIIFYADITDEPANNREEEIQYLLYNGYLLRGIAYWNQDNQNYDELPDLTQYSLTEIEKIQPENKIKKIAAAMWKKVTRVMKSKNIALAQRNPPPTDTSVPSPSLSSSPSTENIKVMAQYVVNGGNPVFYYYDQDYTGSESSLSYPINLGSIKVIKTYLEIDVNSRPPEPYIHETTIQLRNPNS